MTSCHMTSHIQTLDGIDIASSLGRYSVYFYFAGFALMAIRGDVKIQLAAARILQH